MTRVVRRSVPLPDPDAQWASIEQRLAFRAKVRRGARVGGIASTVALALGVAWFASSPAPDVSLVRRMAPRVAALPVHEGAFAWPLADAPLAEPSIFRLGDGSTVTTGPGTRVAMCRGGRSGCVEIRRGEAQVEARQRMIVRAGRVQLETEGAQALHRFVVRYGQAGVAHGDVTVEVIQGRVYARIRDGERTLRRTLEAGDVWRPGAAAPKRDGASQADGAFARARTLALQGAHQEAAEAYASFVQRFPEDPRHATAALELGRLRMDVLHDPAGAIAPLRRAAGVRGPVQADAQSRYVRALHAAKQWSECKRQRQLYDERFPRGVHGPSLAQLCSPGEPSP